MGINIKGEGVEGEIFVNCQSTGLYCKHAYSLLDVFEIKKKNEIIKLLRIRNPWSSSLPHEWNGKFSDSTPELIENLEVINDSIKKRWGSEAEIIEEEALDGSFLMEYKDFLNIWDNLFLSIDFPD